MRSVINRLADAPYRLLAAATVGAFSLADDAKATTVADVANTFNGGLTTLGKTVMGVSFLGGLGFVGAGLLKLKSAADSQGRESYGPGIWRVAAGAGLVGLPAVSAIFRDTATGGNSNTVLQEGSATFQ